MTKDKRLSGGPGWALVRRCPSCGREEAECSCRPPTPEAKPPSRQRPRYRIEKRRGKPVTIVTHLTLTEPDLKDLAGRLKARLGTGGTAKGGEIELQGDHREALQSLLREFGFKA